MSAPPPRPGPGPAPPLSGSEIEALCTRAARGAGMAWGLAEEAGFAAAWLSARGIDGPQALADHLAWAEGRAWQDICPAVSPGLWTAPGGGMLCPVALGATLCDFCTLPDAGLKGRGLVAGPVGHPVLLLPFLAAMARRLDHPVAVSWPHGAVAVTPAGGLAGAVPAIVALGRAQVTLARGAAGPLVQPPAARHGASQAAIDHLTALALRTTVPPSEISRADAGAAGSDND